MQCIGTWYVTSTVGHGIISTHASIQERRVGREVYRVWLIDFSKWRDLFGHPKVDKKIGMEGLGG